jgi:hypothetical protein
VPILHPTVESPELLAQLTSWPGPEGPILRIQIERSATGAGAGYANIGAVTIAASDTELEYTFYDVNGTNSSWYRWYFSNAANTFPTSGERDYSPEIQPAVDGQDLLCSVGDVKQEVGSTSGADDEAILDKIQQVSVAIMGYTRRRFARKPASGTTLVLFDVSRESRTLWIPQGIAEISALEVATETGGTFTTVPTTDWFADPPPNERLFGWPATRITLSDRPTGGIWAFYPGKRVVRAAMAEGWERVPADVRGIAVRASTRRHMAKGGGATPVMGPAGTEFLLPDMSGADRKLIEWYRLRRVG